VIDAAGPACVAVKPQLACFERLGPSGAEALAATVQHAQDAGLLVIADGKRGDIDVSVRAYAQSLFGGLQTPFGTIEGLGVDAATINPLMGADTLQTAVSVARESNRGLIVLVRTSNPGAADVLDLELAPSAARTHGASGGEDGSGERLPQEAVEARTVWERLALLVAELGSGAERSGIADVGAVLGATEPAHLERARTLMPHALFLLPGVGAQGGRVEDLGPVFAHGRHGGLVSASRGIVNAHRQAGGDPAEAAHAEAERLRELAWRLSA
jgi:orotidine-5'-phosphate decarboxylase